MGTGTRNSVLSAQFCCEPTITLKEVLKFVLNRHIASYVLYFVLFFLLTNFDHLLANSLHTRRWAQRKPASRGQDRAPGLAGPLSARGAPRTPRSARAAARTPTSPRRPSGSLASRPPATWRQRLHVVRSLVHVALVKVLLLDRADVVPVLLGAQRHRVSGLVLPATPSLVSSTTEPLGPGDQP